MKTKICGVTAWTLLLAALFALTSCSSSSTKQPPPVGSATISYTKGVPGGVLVQTLKTTATVTALDRAKRKLTLLASDGKQFVVSVGPEATNYDQIQVGDQITATVVQRILVSLEEKDAPSGDGTVAGASLGSKGGQSEETIQMTGTIIAIDSDNRTATLRFEDGNTETLKVRDDLDLSRRKVGEKVVFRTTEMTAIWVEKP